LIPKHDLSSCIEKGDRASDTRTGNIASMQQVRFDRSGHARIHAPVPEKQPYASRQSGFMAM